MVFGYVNGFYQEHCLTEGISQSDCSLTSRIYDDFVNANFIWIFAALICFMVSNLFRAVQWSLLLEPIDHKPKFYNSFWGVMLGYFANLGLPRMGEFIRSGTMSRYEDIAYEKVIASVVNSRIIDLVLLGLTTILAMILEYEKVYNFYLYVGDKYGFSSIYIIGLSGLIGLAIFILILSTHLSNNKIIQKVQVLALSFKDGLLSIFKVKDPFQLIGCSILIWVMYVLMTYFGFWAYGPTSEISFSAGLVVFVIGAFGFVIPSSGGMGTYHALTIIALSFYSISAVDAFSYAMILFMTLQIGANIVFGLLSLILLPRLNANNQ